ncbi:MAG: hypothetical protein OEZ34_06395 [Spirochaetia bacterium]|nr:hypothetical protein [Spirochaetia bacterium]
MNSPKIITFFLIFSASFMFSSGEICPDAEDDRAGERAILLLKKYRADKRRTDYKKIQVVSFWSKAGEEITDDELKDLEGLVNLWSLDLRDCKKLTDGALEHLVKLKKLDHLYVKESGIPRLALIDFSYRMNHRVVFDLGWIRVSDEVDFNKIRKFLEVYDGFYEKDELETIESLDLSGEYINSNQFADNIVYLKTLREINLSNTKIDDEAIVHLAWMPALEELNLKNTQITDKSIPYLAKMNKIQYLNLRGTKISEREYEILRMRLPDAEIKYYGIKTVLDSLYSPLGEFPFVFWFIPLLFLLNGFGFAYVDGLVPGTRPFRKRQKGIFEEVGFQSPVALGLIIMILNFIFQIIAYEDAGFFIFQNISFLVLASAILMVHFYMKLIMVEGKRNNKINISNRRTGNYLPIFIFPIFILFPGVFFFNTIGMVFPDLDVLGKRFYCPPGYTESVSNHFSTKDRMLSGKTGTGRGGASAGVRCKGELGFFPVPLYVKNLLRMPLALISIYILIGIAEIFSYVFHSRSIFSSLVQDFITPFAGLLSIYLLSISPLFDLYAKIFNSLFY